MATRKLKCEVKHDFACTGMAIRYMTGKKKGDPKFYCCYGCETYLRRQGVRMVEVKGAK